MVDLNSLVVDGCQPFDEGLLDEADMSEILGGPNFRNTII